MLAITSKQVSKLKKSLLLSNHFVLFNQDYSYTEFTYYGWICKMLILQEPFPDEVVLVFV